MTCTCPEGASGWWDGDPDCPEHGQEIAREANLLHVAETQAEDGWLRAAEYDPRMSDPREW